VFVGGTVSTCLVEDQAVAHSNVTCGPWTWVRPSVLVEHSRAQGTRSASTDDFPIADSAKWTDSTTADATNGTPKFSVVVSSEEEEE